MPEKIKQTIVALLVLLWACSFVYLTYISTDPLQWIALSVIAFLTMVFVVFLSQSLKQQNFYEKRLRRLQIFSSIAGEFADVVAFDEQGRTVYTTHPHIYPNQKEFLRKTLLKVSSSEEAATFKKWIEEHHSGEIILSSGGDGLGQQKKRWLARIRSIDPTLMGGKNYILVVLTNLTKYLDGYHQLREHYNNLEMFLNEAPFALFYASKSQHIIGCNDTFSSWLNAEKDRLLGEKSADFIEGFNDFFHEQNPRIVTLKPKNKSTFKALYIPPQKNNSKIQASIICKLDQTFIPATKSSDDLTNEISFVKSRIPSLVIDKKGLIICMNHAFNTLLSNVINMNNEIDPQTTVYDLLDPPTVKDMQGRINHIFSAHNKLELMEIVFGSNKHPMMAHISILNDSLNESFPSKLLLQFIDISEQKRLELQFSQSQKMQAVGLLAGGIAHDFNNLLTAMIGFCDLLLQRYMPNNPSYMDVMQIKQNANRAANLVRQLLAFSRQQSLQPKVIDITDTLSEVSALLRRLIGVNIELNLIHGDDLYPILADVSQFEQVLINMVVNARDAMSGNGVLTIRTSNHINPRQKQLGHEVMEKGDYVLLEIEDNGTGIPQEIVDRIFDPFFSTKEVGAGTGLGLSTVYGIIKQSNGFVVVDTKLHEGTCFKIYFPKSQEPYQKKCEIEDEPIPSNLFGGGTILLVEDEEAVRMFSARALKERGYNVIEAENGEDALNIVKSNEKFDLLITDVVMPKMDGPTLNKHVRDYLPEMKTIFISGYAEDTFRQNLGCDSQIHFLPKPFSLKDLIKKVQEVLTI